MALLVNWTTKVITVPQSDLTHVTGLIYQLNVYDFKRWCDDIMDGTDGIANIDIINHNTVVVLGGIPYARTIEIINGYTVTFEDGQYAVNLIGANTNLADVTNVNQVSIRPNNSAGLIDNTSGAEDNEEPIWSSTIGITNANQNNDTIVINWGAATDANPVTYNIYISQFVVSLFDSVNLLNNISGYTYTINNDGVEDLIDGVTYYIGVRAIDSKSNETDNTNYSIVTFVQTVVNISDQDIHDALDSYENKNDYKAGSVDMTETNNLITSSKEEIIAKVEDSEGDIRDAIIDVQFGNWTIENNQMIVFDKELIEIARFNLFDAAGNPTMRAVYKRELV